MTATPTDPVPHVHGTVQPHAHEHVENHPHTADPGPAVRLEGLEKRFGDVAAVDGIDLEIGDGEFFSMLGPSGSGKTTTLRMIAGFELPTAGRVLLHGHDVTGPRAVRARREHRVPGLRAVPAHDGRGQRRVRPRDPPRRQGRARPARRRGAGDGPPRGLRQAQAGPAVGRPAPAGRARARAREPAPCPAARRAARCARPQAPRGDAGRAQAASSSRSGSRSSTSPTTRRRRSR